MPSTLQEQSREYLLSAQTVCPTVSADRPSFSMLGWAFNEEDSIAEYIEKAEQFLKKLTPNYELIIIDDGSTDRTREIIERARQTHSWLRLQCNERNRGSGFNTKLAISLARKDYLFWQTVDWAYDIERLQDCWPLLQQYDVLQGVRVPARSLGELLHDRSDTPFKAVVSIVNYWLIRLLFRLPVHDYQNVTVYPRRLIQSIPLQTESAFTNPECLLKAWWQGATIKEFLVPFLKRRTGKGKGTRLPAILRAIGEIVYWRFAWAQSTSNHGRVVAWDDATILVGQGSHASAKSQPLPG